VWFRLSEQDSSKVSITDKSPTKGKIKPTSVVYWLRFFLAIGAGVTNNYLHIGTATFGDFALFVGIGLGVIFYALSLIIVRYALKYDETQLRGKNRYITLGGGTFIVVWVMVSVALNTLTGGA
jgi:hypothetical protein